MNHHYFAALRMRIALSALLLLFFLRLVTAQAQSVTAAAGRYQIDNQLKLILCNQLPAFPTGQAFPSIQFDKAYTFTESVQAFEIGKPYKVTNNNVVYTLYFTRLPLIEINTQGNQEISNNDNRTKGTFTLANANDPLFSSNMGIRIRGNISRRFPKKSYNMELWQNPDGNEKLETSLLGMRKDSKWFLLAMYNEPLRLNNATAHALWLDMHKVYYIAQEPDANSAIRTKYCDVFVNGSYTGVYMFTEPMDRKQLKLKKTGDGGEIRGELYKADGFSEANTFTGLPAPPANPAAEVWGGFEMDYPDPYWNNLYNLVKFVVTSPADDFKASVSSKLKMDNLIDYFIFLNAVEASDNFGNNQFVARYKENEPYFLLPWDLDGTLGYLTTSERNLGDVRSISKNGLFDRLLALDPDGFKSKMRNRWFALRRSDFALQTLKNRIEANYNLLNNEGAYARETMKWPGTIKTDDLPYLLSRLEARLVFLDEYFALFPTSNSGIELTYFQGEAVPEGKNLSWSTRYENNAKEFVLEFSTDGATFNPVTTIPTTGNSQTGQTYFFAHNDASALAFYRLKKVTSDNQFTYSPFIQVGTNSCSGAPAAPFISANPTEITDGQTVVLTASGCSETVVWSTGQTGISVQVKPEVNTLYTAKCRRVAGCESPASNPVTITVHPQGSLPGNFDGYMGGIDCRSLRGWAWNGNKPNTPIYVEILDDQRVVATIIADDFRQDLLNAGKGNGMHGFTFSIPETLKDNRTHTLSGRVLGATFILKDSPKKLTCQGAQSPANQPPVAPSVPLLSARVNVPFTATLPAFNDPDSPTLTYTLTGLPGELSFAANTRTISGTPTAKANLTLTYTASDGSLSTSVTVLLSISDQSTPPPVVTGNFEGYLDKVECGSIRGWVWDTDKPNEPFTVEFFANGTSIGTARADIFRSDLLSAGKGNGYHVYNFPTPASVKTGQTVQISAKVQNSNYTLNWAPKPLNCPATGPENPPTNQPPVAPSVLPLSATVNSAFSATLPAFTDPNNDPLTYTLTGLPSGLSFAANTRTISGTTTTKDNLTLTYSATDGTLSTSVTVLLSISDQSTPPPVVTGNFEGYLDKVECGSIRGWVWDRDKPNEPFTVEFFANGTSIGTARADIFRPDLLSAGKGNGYHVYNFPTPASVKTGQTVQISAKVQNSNYTLNWAPKPLNCAPNARLNVSTDQNAASGLVLVNPNPSNGEFEVRFYSTTAAPGELSVVDELGRPWYKKTMEGFVGQHRHHIRLSGASGTYVVVVRQGQAVRSAKILIIR
ncbi:hypothetical protein GCM10027347_10670 [Larkinella harenae]